LRVESGKTERVGAGFGAEDFGARGRGVAASVGEFPDEERDGGEEEPEDFGGGEGHT
jgi:hypothetical protein